MARDRPEPAARRVLLVDDDPLILEVLTTILDLEEFEVTTAGDGRSALDVLAQEDVDVVVCDVMMPGIDGLEVCRRIKQDAQRAGLPVILLSARDRPEDREAGEVAGCDAYLTKPFSPLQLIEVIRGMRGGDRTGGAASEAGGRTAAPGQTAADAVVEEAPREDD